MPSVLPLSTTMTRAPWPMGVWARSESRQAREYSSAFQVRTTIETSGPMVLPPTRLLDPPLKPRQSVLEIRHPTRETGHLG